MTRIKKISAREILDSRGNPTLEVSVHTKKYIGTAAVPSGASTGKHEAMELRDDGTRYGGQGVLQSVRNVAKIAPYLLGENVNNQSKIDQIMLDLDGTKNKSKLGANTILGISMACARAAAGAVKLPLYVHLNKLILANFGKKTKLYSKMKLPIPYSNVINGGKHADNKLSIQEFMIVPQFRSISKNIQALSEVYHQLKKDLHQTYGQGSTNVGDEGGFAPEQFKLTTEVLDILQKSIYRAGYKGKISIAIDAAASEFYSKKMYLVDGKKLSADKLIEFYLNLIKKYPITSIEDPFQQDDFISFAKLRKLSKIQIVGDDLTVTNTARINMAIAAESCNCLLLKINQIGTLTEALDAAKLASESGWNIMVSHRSGETTDTFISDLAVALGCGQIKIGAPCRGERVAKYNRLLEINSIL